MTIKQIVESAIKNKFYVVNSTRTFSTNGNEITSYSTIIAIRESRDSDKWLISSKKYSMTTSKQIRKIKEVFDENNVQWKEATREEIYKLY